MGNSHTLPYTSASMASSHILSSWFRRGVPRSKYQLSPDLMVLPVSDSG